MKRFLSWILAIFMLCSLAACGGEPAPQTPKGLVLKAPKDVRVVLSAGFEEGVPVAPTETYEEGAHFICYRYEGLNGAYRVETTALGCYTVTRNIAVEPGSNLSLDVTPEKMAGTGWEPAEVQIFADPLRTSPMFSADVAQWPDYQAAFTTPWFTEDHAQHQTTSQAQMEAYLTSLDDPQDDLYLYSTGITSTFRHDIPMAVLTKTDLSGAKTLEEMAQALDNGKPTILYRAQLHGNEPAGGEAALAVISLLDSQWGHYLDTMNICIVPRGNPDSAQSFIRNVAGSTDPNRDSLRARTDEVVSYLQLCQLLLPEVIIDGHEYQCHVVDGQVEGGDMLVGVGYTTESSTDFRALGLEVAAQIFAGTEKNGLTCRYYSNTVNTMNTNVSRAYSCNTGSLFFLLESRGIGMGTEQYPRRIISHVVSLESMLTFVEENQEKVVSTVEAERQLIIHQGSLYREAQQIPLETAPVDAAELAHKNYIYDQLTGDIQEITTVPVERMNPTKGIIAPTAYVIPAGERFTETVLELMDLHQICYTLIPAGSKVKLQQYTTEGLSEETTVTFPQGAYVICKNQLGSRNLSQMMEPEIPDHGATKGSLAAQGILSPEEGVYPLYRYIHDLNAQGFIDYQ